MRLNPFAKRARPRENQPDSPRFEARATASPVAGAWRSVAAALGEGEELPEPLLDALRAELSQRANGVVAGWPVPLLSSLRVRRAGLPDWWGAGGNLMLVGEGAHTGGVVPAYEGNPSNALFVLGNGAALREALFGGTSSIIAMGDRTTYPLVGIQANDGLVLVGEEGGATVHAQVDARNHGAVLMGADTIMGGGTRIITDDMHAIRDRASGRRINPRGGRIAIGSHVWIGEQVLISGESVIGDDTVIGTGSFVRGVALPAHSVCVGRPARLVRVGTTWTRADDP